MPLTFAGFTASQGPEWLTVLTAYLGRGQPAFMIIYAALIMFFAFFYNALCVPLAAGVLYPLLGLCGY